MKKDSNDHEKIPKEKKDKESKHKKKSSQNNDDTKISPSILADSHYSHQHNSIQNQQVAPLSRNRRRPAPSRPFSAAINPNSTTSQPVDSSRAIQKI